MPVQSSPYPQANSIMLFAVVGVQASAVIVRDDVLALAAEKCPNGSPVVMQPENEEIKNFLASVPEWVTVYGPASPAPARFHQTSMRLMVPLLTEVLSAHPAGMVLTTLSLK